nr:ribonuclease D [Pseudoxanthomonas spadix]
MSPEPANPAFTEETCVTLWIDTADALRAHLQQLPAWVGMDTEFIREKTFWPQLALVQIAIGDRILLVDPLVPGINQALAPLLSNPDVVKVMHSASEDLVALGWACGTQPSPLFDTQIAAALAGVGGGLGYQKLVAEITGVPLAKGETRSDWLRRPLSAAQLEYAADDVTHLGAIYQALSARLDALGRSAWLAADCARMVAQASDAGGERWPHLSMRSAQFVDADAQRRLLRLLRWREAQARASDRPRSWILDNELALTLARNPPASRQALTRWLEQQPKAPRKLADAIWEALSTPLEDEAEAPLAKATDQDKQRLKKLQDAVARQAAALGLPDGILASRRWLEALMERGQWPAALSGWRREQLEEVLAPLLPPAP